MKGVITADVVGSTQIKKEEQGELPKLINDLIREIEQSCSKLQVQITRGDSFQVLVEEAEKAPLVALLLRAGFRKSSLQSGNKQLDVRMSVGIGEVSYLDEQVAQSNGEAFVLSGRGFDKLSKLQRLNVQTSSEAINAELRVETAFVDDIVSNWTPLHSETMYQALLTNASQGELAKKAETSQQNIGKRLDYAKEKLVRMYLERVSFLILSEQNKRKN